MNDELYTFEDYIKDFELDYLGFDGIPDEPVSVFSPEISNMNFSIRLVTIEDYDAIYDLWNSTEQSRRALNPVDDSREGIERYLKRNPNTCFAPAIMSGKDYTYDPSICYRRETCVGITLQVPFYALP